jgi:hypothetical protein
MHVTDRMAQKTQQAKTTVPQLAQDFLFDSRPAARLLPDEGADQKPY